MEVVLHCLLLFSHLYLKYREWYVVASMGNDLYLLEVEVLKLVLKYYLRFA